MDKSVFTREYAILLALLRAARQEAKLTQNDLAKLLGQSQSFVSKCERGERRLDLVQMRAFCQVFGLSLTAFVARFEAKLGKTKR